MAYCGDLLKRGKEDPEKIESAIKLFDYRLTDIMGTATTYRNLLGAADWFPRCEDIDAADWPSTRVKAGTVGSIQRKVYHEALGKIWMASLFDKVQDEGPPYQKGAYYLAALMATNMWGTEAIGDSILKLKSWRKTNGKFVRSAQYFELARQRGVRDALISISQKTNRRLRSLSPIKSGGGLLKEQGETW